MYRSVYHFSLWLYRIHLAQGLVGGGGGGGGGASVDAVSGQARNQNIKLDSYGP